MLRSDDFDLIRRGAVGSSAGETETEGAAGGGGETCDVVVDVSGRSEVAVDAEKMARMGTSTPL
jgi:hypothetical protein